MGLPAAIHSSLAVVPRRVFVSAGLTKKIGGAGRESKKEMKNHFNLKRHLVNENVSLKKELRISSSKNLAAWSDQDI